MAKYIPLDVLVAEIERRRDCYKIEKSEKEIGHRDKLLLGARIAQCEELLSFIDTLEVKEVDFDAEWEIYFEHRGEMTTVNVKHLAKYFFELGLKAQKGEMVC